MFPACWGAEVTAAGLDTRIHCCLTGRETRGEITGPTSDSIIYWVVRIHHKTIFLALKKPCRKNAKYPYVQKLFSPMLTWGISWFSHHMKYLTIMIAQGFYLVCIKSRPEVHIMLAMDFFDLPICCLIKVNYWFVSEGWYVFEKFY